MVDKQLEKQQKDDEFQQKKINKLLLLGAGACGKSTLFKQMVAIYGRGFPESVMMKQYVPCS